MELCSTENFDADLDRIRTECLAAGKPDDSDLITVFLDLIVSDDDALFFLTRSKDTRKKSPYFNVCIIEFFIKQGYNISRCRPYFKNLDIYRLIYAFDPIRDEIHLLAAVLKKPENIPEHIIDEKYYGYEQAHTITARIRADYRELNIPRLS